MIGFGNRDHSGLQIYIIDFQRQQFPDPHPGPEQNLKCQPGFPLIDNTVGKCIEFLFGPEAHLISFAFSHTARGPARIVLQSIIADRVIKNCAELVIDGLQIRLGISLVDEFRLPFANISRSYLIHFLFSEIRKHLVIHNVVLIDHGMLPEPRFHILEVQIREVLKPHVEIALLLQQEIPKPFLGFPSRVKSPLHALSELSRPVTIAILNQPFSCLLVFFRFHQVVTSSIP